MILAFQDDGCVHLYPSLDAVVLAVEALDAEDCFRAVFDDRGQRYVIEWLQPNQRGWIGVANGHYRLIPCGEPDPKGLLEELVEVGTRGLTDRDRVVVEALQRRLVSAS